jgi:hypothetical protein
MRGFTSRPTLQIAPTARQGECRPEQIRHLRLKQPPLDLDHAGHRKAHNEIRAPKGSRVGLINARYKAEAAIEQLARLRSEYFWLTTLERLQDGDEPA